MKPSEPELVAVDGDPRVGELARLARQTLQGEATRRDAASFARLAGKPAVGGGVVENRPRRGPEIG